jgi:tRNA (mo5U34)-methyltransferase
VSSVPASNTTITSHTKSIRHEIDALGEWFHNMNLDGEWTAPRHYLGDFPRVKWERIQTVIPADLTGRTVLDIGCNAGFYSLELKSRGADLVVAIDSDPRYLAQARLAAQTRDLQIDFRQMSVYDIGTLRRRFDLVLFMGVLYHLRHPLLALDLISEHVVNRQLIFQSLLRGDDSAMAIDVDYPFSETDVFSHPGYPVMHFVENKYAHDPTNWWIPNRACAEAMLRSAGFSIIARPDDDVFFCQLTSSRSKPAGANLHD